MEESINPYAPSLVTGALDHVPESLAGDVYRKGKLLVMHKEAQLPPYCIKTNEPADEWIERKLHWHSPWWMLLILIHVFVWAIVAVLIQKKAKIKIGLTRHRWSLHRRRRGLLIASLLLAVWPSYSAL